MISIIMPAYNSGQYIDRAIRSIIDQSYNDFELIIVDDGSLDNTLEKCQEYQRMDKRIQVYSKKNGGICSARNMGLQIANGEYITFCDNDDTFEKDLLKENINLAKKNNADIVRWNFKTIIDENMENSKIRNFSDRVIYGKEDLAKYYLEVRQTSDAVWNGLFKSDFLKKNKIRFNETMLYGGEDLCFSLDALSFFPCIVLNSKSFYNWYMRSSHSTSARRNHNFCDSMINNAKIEYKLVSSLEILDEWDKIKNDYVSYILSYANSISIFCGMKYRKIIKMEEWAR